MTSTSGRSRTIRSPRATCCLTIAYSSAVRLAGLAQDLVRDADLADVVEQPGDADRGDLLGRQPEPLGEEDAVAGDVLGVLLGVAILRVDREDQPLEDVERAGLDLGLDRSGRRPGPRRRRSPSLPGRSAPWRSGGPSPSRRGRGTGRRRRSRSAAGARTRRTGASGRRASRAAARGRRSSSRPTRPGRPPGTRPARTARSRRRPAAIGGACRRRSAAPRRPRRDRTSR